MLWHRLWGNIRLILLRYFPIDHYWSGAVKCVFCGAHTGKEAGTYLQQHRPRCRWIGPANLFVWQHPNYFQMIEEDDPHYLEMMHSNTQLPKVQKELNEVKAKLALLEAKQEKKPDVKKPDSPILMA